MYLEILESKQEVENLAHAESQKGHLAAEKISSLKIINAASGMMEAGQQQGDFLSRLKPRAFSYQQRSQVCQESTNSHLQIN